MGKIEDREAYLEKLKEKQLSQTEEMAARQRFGLFSQPPCLGIGDTKYRKIVHKRGEDGRPVTESRNIFQGPARSGKGKKGYFEEPSYITIGDTFNEQYKLERKDEMENRSKVPNDWPRFKDQCKWEQKIKPEYEYIELQENKKGKVVLNLNEMGKPVTQEPNVKVPQNINYLYKFRPHMKDEYDRVKQFNNKERLDHLKAMKDNPPFKTWDNVDKPFQSDKKTFGLDIALPPKKQYVFQPKIHPHEAPFKYPNPAKKGWNKTIGKFPKYMEDPLREVKRKKLPEDYVKKDSFKLTNPHDKSKPCTSISANFMNLRRVMTTMSTQKY